MFLNIHLLAAMGEIVSFRFEYYQELWIAILLLTESLSLILHLFITGICENLRMILMSVILDGVPINFQCYLLDITHPKSSALRNTNKWTLETLQRPN